MGDQNSSPVGIGVISIITVLLVLCLTIFSALTLSSAKADLALSQKNADTVAAYYEADAKAAALYRDFATGGAQTMEETIPMTENQFLHLQLARDEDGTIQILSWRTQFVEGAEIDSTLPVWDGESSEG